MKGGGSVKCSYLNLLKRTIYDIIIDMSIELKCEECPISQSKCPLDILDDDNKFTGDADFIQCEDINCPCYDCKVEETEWGDLVGVVCMRLSGGCDPTRNMLS